MLEPLLAATRTYLQFSRLQSLDEWWHWGALASAIMAVVGIVMFLYRRDASELNRPLRWLLMFLRVVALVGLLLFFLGLEKRSEELLVRNSRAILLVDASQSMSIVDQVTGVAPTSPEGRSRIDQAVDALEPAGLVEALRANHDVVVYRCDDSQRPTELTTYSSLVAMDADDEGAQTIGSFAEARRLMGLAAVVGLVAMIALLVAFVAPTAVLGAEGENWALLTGVVLAVTALVLTGVSNIRNPEYSVAELIRGVPDAPASTVNAQNPSTNNRVDGATTADLRSELRPSGNTTRLGDALIDIIENERGGPISGIGVLSDGNSNAGVSLRDAGSLAATANVPIFPVGFGDDQPPTNVRLVDVEAPPRVFPGDGFKIKGYFQSFGFAGMSIPVRLTESNAAQDGQDTVESAGTLVDERLIRFERDGEVVIVEFEVEPLEEGDRVYKLEGVAPSSDLDSSDNSRSTVVRVVDRKTKVLLFAGGPTRDYRFVRNLLYRDPGVTLHVLLQSAPADAAQEADEQLTEFPSSADELFAYDAVVAFDPDWDDLSELQLKLLDRWIAEKAGGLIVVAGPVFTPEWTGRKRSRPGDRILKALYPVQFYSGTSAVLGRNRYAAREAWPLKMTANGLALEHLQLEDETSGFSGWESFEGVYGYFPVRGVKPAATVLAQFSNPDTKIEDELPPFLAYHFYGAGRVYYIGSGEFWRLHSISNAVFERFYTKLVRFVSEGRLLRDSNRGVLLVDKERAAPGETITIRCTLTDAQFNPAQDSQVQGTIVTPDNQRTPIVLQPEDLSTRPGNYLLQTTLSAVGDYRVEVPVPDSPDLEILTKGFRLRVPDREIEDPQRNDAKLSELAEISGGTYYVNAQAARAAGSDGLVAQMVPQDQRTYVPGTPDRGFQERLMWWYLALICGMLSLEWTLRRLNRLA